MAFWCFRALELDDDSLVAFGASFGELEHFGAYSGRLEPRMVRVGNVDDDGNIRAADDRLRAMAVADGLWHVDSSYREVPARYSMLLAERVAAVGGATEFADTSAAYEALPDDLKKQLEHGVAVHDFHRSRARAGYELSEDSRTALPPACPAGSAHEPADGASVVVHRLAHPPVRRHVDRGKRGSRCRSWSSWRPAQSGSTCTPGRSATWSFGTTGA